MNANDSTHAGMSSNLGMLCSEYNFQQLSELYNQGRVDYIVPMPMNAKRMSEYITAHDVSLTHSVVAIDKNDHQPNGMCMLGVRGERSWVTRLGVIPERRRRKSGEFLMNEALRLSGESGIRHVQLEVIRGNDPAQTLFEKLGFKVIRDLVVIRRPPTPLQAGQMSSHVRQYANIEDNQEILRLLNTRDDAPTWIEETASLINGGGMRVITLTLDSGEEGWIAFQRTPFQLTHLVFNPQASPQMIRTLLRLLHELYPLQDTKVENLPENHPALPHFYAMGYVNAFERIEMVLTL